MGMGYENMGQIENELYGDLENDADLEAELLALQGDAPAQRRAPQRRPSMYWYYLNIYSELSSLEWHIFGGRASGTTGGGHTFPEMCTAEKTQYVQLYMYIMLQSWIQYFEHLSCFRSDSPSSIHHGRWALFCPYVHSTSRLSLLRLYCQCVHVPVGTMACDVTL